MTLLLGLRRFRFLTAAVFALAASTASAQRVEGEAARAQGAYAAEVQVNGQGEGERRNAFARGLSQVLSKISGTRNVASLPGVGQELRRAADYVEGYDYRQDEGVSRTGAPSFRTLLVVRFDPEKVDALADTLGIPIWAQPRPKPVLWLAIDDGRGPRLVGLAQSNAARAALDQAVARGYRLGLPAGNAAEQAVVGAIWRGDTAAIARASARYSPPMQLVGKLYRNKGGWTAEWTFVDAGKVLNRWTVDHADARQAMTAGADGAADALVKRYAKRSPSGPPGQYVVSFIGIDTAAEYMRLSGYLQSLAVVRGIVPLRATPGGVELQLELLSGMPGFKRATSSDDVLVPVEAELPVYQLR